ncbi:MAG: hypothetical protein R3Y33_07460 [Clostridia bacterium]
MNTNLSIESTKFLINNKLTYSEIENCPKEYHGLLMNSRMIQGIFDDASDVTRFNRYGKEFSADKNTDEFIDSLQDWYNHGLRAVAVGFQGGGPCFTMDNHTIDNNPFSEDGLSMKQAYLDRMEKVILAADKIGMIVIVSYFYGAQTRFIKDDISIMNAVKTASNWLRDKKFTNVFIEIANEQDVGDFKIHPIVYTGKGMATLIEIAKRESGGMAVGCSSMGGCFNEDIANASDVILIHGNGQDNQKYYNLIQKAKAIKPERPILCNESSQALSQISVSLNEFVSWGYYNNMTKQEPPTYWEILDGEDKFFAYRICEYFGIETEKLEEKEQFYIQGLEKQMSYEDKRWIRLASLYPENIDYVEFFRDKNYVASAYCDPFMLNSVGSNWLQKEFSEKIENGELWSAKIHLRDKKIVEISYQY